MSGEYLANRIKQTCTGSGTANLNIAAGTAAVGHRKISAVYSVGDVGMFVLESGDSWELFWGTVATTTTTADTLERTTIIESTNGGAKISLDPIEIHTVQAVLPEQLAIYLNGDDIIERQDMRNAIGEAIAAETTSDMPSTDLVANQIVVKIGNSSANDGGGGIYYYTGAAFAKIKIAPPVDDSTIEYATDEIRVKDNGVTLAKLATMATNSFLGRINSGTGNVEVLSVANVKTILDYQASQIDYSNATSSLTATDVQAAIDEIEGRLDTAESNISSSGGDISGLESDVATLQSDLATAEGDITTLQSDLGTAETDISTLQSDVAALQVDSGGGESQSVTSGGGTFDILTYAALDAADAGQVFEIVINFDDGSDLFYGLVATTGTEFANLRTVSNFTGSVTVTLTSSDESVTVTNNEGSSISIDYAYRRIR